MLIYTIVFSLLIEASIAQEDQNLPVPSGLAKTNATSKSLILSFVPPANYLTDDRYNYFRVEYRYDANTEWKEASIPKNSNPNNVEVPISRNLLEGVLYIVRMRSEKREGDSVTVSAPTPEIRARTKPLPVSKLSVIQSQTNWAEAIVSWNKPPIHAFKSKYDSTTLNYFIAAALSKELEKKYPLQTRVFTASSLENPIQSVAVPIEVGAVYHFEIYTTSDGYDPTNSVSVHATAKFDYPGPINIRKSFENETSITLKWERNPGVENTTGYLTEWAEEERNERFQLNSSLPEVQISNLRVGAHYTFQVRSRQDNNVFGKLSEATSFTTRTKPPALSGVEVTERTEASLTIQFDIPDAYEYGKIEVVYQIEDGSIPVQNQPDIKINKQNKTGMVVLSGLSSAGLYRINLTIFSEPEPHTFNTISYLARTKPKLPTNIKAMSERGTIYLSWRAPSMYSSAIWHYKVDYYPINRRNDSKSLCQIKGQPLQRVTLPNLLSGTGYVIRLTTVAGEDCSRNPASIYPTYSLPSQELLTYTQPSHPKIKFWKQITVNSVRISWTPRKGNANAQFDYYVISVKRLRNKNSFVPFQKEELVKEVSKDQDSQVFKLSQGAYYKITVTTAVGPLGGGHRSIVIPDVNSIQIKTWHRYYDQFLFRRLQWKFTTCRTRGRFGPTQLLCDSYYRNKNLYNFVEVKNGVQNWMVPLTGLYRIVAAGAGYEGSGGLGAVVSGLFHLKEGSNIRIAVGQRGKSLGARMSIGGGGGTFVVAESREEQGVLGSDYTEVMLVAGGAGGAPPGPAGTPIIQPANARLSLEAGNGSDVGNGYGKGGRIGQDSNGGMVGVLGTGGGAGYHGIADSPSIASAADKVFSAVGFIPFSGENQSLNQSELEKYVPLAGGRYESAANGFSEGGFGGGGCGYLSAFGGGGGYTGGGGGSSQGYSGGGGSFIKFTGGTEEGEVANDQDGYVTITVVGLPSVSPVPVILYLVVSFVVGIAIVLICGAGLHGVSRCAEKYYRNMEDNQALNRNENSQFRNIAENDGISNFGFLREDAEENCSSFDDEDDAGIEAPHEGQEQGVTSLAKPSLEQNHDCDEIDSETFSTVSSVSSMEMYFNEDQVDTQYHSHNKTTKSQSCSSLSHLDSSESELSLRLRSTAKEESLISPRTPPPELANEKQKEEFRKKFTMFRELAERSRKNGETQNNKTFFIPSTNL